MRTTADRATKHNSQGENLSVKTEQELSKATPAISRKEKSKTTRWNKTTTELDQRDRVENTIAKPFNFVENDIKMKGCQREQSAKAYEWKTLTNLLSSDPVLQVLKPKLID